MTVPAFAVTHVVGLAAFFWPVVLARAPGGGESAAHAADAPVLVALLSPLLVLVAVDQARRRGDARLVALLGALVAVNTVLRIPKGPTGEGVAFVLPILAGWSLGARFGFLLGAFTMVVSAVVTGGVGPWLPFQMFALGWVGMGAGVLRRLVRGRGPVVALGVYAWVSSLAYGFVMTLWFWPFLGRHGPTFFTPGLDPVEALVRYARFYAITSLPWDTGRALVTNVPLVAVLARPVGRLLDRWKERFSPSLGDG